MRSVSSAGREGFGGPGGPRGSSYSLCSAAPIRSCLCMGLPADRRLGPAVSTRDHLQALQYGRGADTETPQVGSGSLSFCGISGLFVVFY